MKKISNLLVSREISVENAIGFKVIAITVDEIFDGDESLLIEKIASQYLLRSHKPQ
jgi:hypothetical protein